MSNTPIDKLLPLEIRELINRLAQQTAASINDSEGIPELRQTMSKELRETIQLAVKGKLRELALAMLPHAERDATIRELRALAAIVDTNPANPYSWRTWLGEHTEALKIARRVAG